MIGVVFYDQHWHVGLTDGRDMVDSSYFRNGVTRRELEPGYREIVWLEPALGRAAWNRANARIGEPYALCTRFVCECLGGYCVLPGNVKPQLEELRRRARDASMEAYRRRRARFL